VDVDVLLDILQQMIDLLRTVADRCEDAELQGQCDAWEKAIYSAHDDLLAVTADIRSNHPGSLAEPIVLNDQQKQSVITLIEIQREMREIGDRLLLGGEEE
jgi:hypothetical protein